MENLIGKNQIIYRMYGLNKGESIMNYKKLLDKLEHDTSVSNLALYLSGKRRIDRRTATPEQKAELLNKVIPKLIKDMHKEIDTEIKDWYNAPIFRLAYIHCLNNRIDLNNIFNVANEICNRINKDSDNIAITQRFKEYHKRTVNTELI